MLHQLDHEVVFAGIEMLGEGLPNFVDLSC
jgi:hypothetical protein